MITQTNDSKEWITHSFNNSSKNYFTPTVLVVEDDADNRELLKFILEMWNFRVVEAKDGIEAFYLAESICPDLILMDVKLPLLDGLETTRKIRHSATISQTPIIFLSGCAEMKYRNAANEVGANAYLVKPFDFDKLQFIITEQINFTKTL